MPTVTSKDGTQIAYDKIGQGPALIIVGGAIGTRTEDAPFADALSKDFTTINYDRRGRGDSADTLPYALEREIEDIEALIEVAGSPPILLGFSSGAALAFEAAYALKDRVAGLAMYEAPYNDDPQARQNWREYTRNLNAALADNRRGDAVGLFMMLTGMPAEDLDGMRQQPFWPALEAVAPTLAYDAAAMGPESAVPRDRAATLTTPTLVMDGGATPWPFMHTSALTLAATIPNAQHRTLPDQTHEVAPEALAPVMREFFKA